MVIIISGVVFMHKEVTSTGEIITHIHPYNFTKKKSQQEHHKSDDEIQYLNVVFQGAYVNTDIVVFEFALSPLEFYVGYPQLTPHLRSTELLDAYYLRGPPVSWG